MKANKEFFDAYDDDFLKFADIPRERRLHHRPDINAFLLLDSLRPGESDMVTAAEHDEIYLAVSPGEVDATEEQWRDLIRCGVRYDSSTESFAMFV